MISREYGPIFVVRCKDCRRVLGAGTTEEAAKADVGDSGNEIEYKGERTAWVCGRCDWGATYDKRPSKMADTRNL